jgi:hypothetical protein
VAFPGYTTEVFDTHKTDGRRILYRWHPFYGKDLAISGMCIRRGTVMFICRIDGTPWSAEHPFGNGPWIFNQADLTKARFFKSGAHGVTGRAAIPTRDQSGFDFSST